MGHSQVYWALFPRFIDEKLRTRESKNLTTFFDVNKTAPFPPLV